jgi:hypothetical protein
MLAQIRRPIRRLRSNTADTALAVLLKDLKANFIEGLKHNLPLPFNALSTTQLFASMAKKNGRTNN